MLISKVQYLQCKLKAALYSHSVVSCACTADLPPEKVSLGAPEDAMKV